MSAERRIKALGLTLPPVSSPVANYVNAVQTGKAAKKPASGARRR